MSRTDLAQIISRAIHQIRVSKALQQPLTEVAEREAERAKTRRSFLKGTAVLGATFALPNLSSATEIFTSARAPVIAIVGGGTAGLTCAYRLKQRGVTAQVYEATNRTGGRMFSDRTTFAAAGQVCELGGELIDTGHRTMRRMAKEFGLKLEDHQKDVPGLSDLVGYFAGRAVPYAELLEEFTPIAAAIDASLATLKRPNAGISYRRPNGGAWIDALSLTEWLDKNHISGIGRSLIEVSHIIEWGLDACEMNAYDMLGLISTDTSHINVYGDSDERFHIAGGNDQIPTALASRLSGQINTNHVLQCISQCADGRYTLTFNANGTTKEIIADHVVSAIPFKILRQIDLNLDLPALKRTAIAELGYGQNSKTMTGYNSRPWRAQGSDGQAYSDLPFQNSWDTTQMQAGAHGILTEYTGGSIAVAAGTGSTAAHATAFVNQIDKVYPGCKSAYTGKAVRMAWNKMPFNLGSYSAYLVGQYTKFASTEGDRVGNLHFGGEHTDFDNQGYMEGAAASGERCANEVLADLGIPALTAAG